MNLILIRHGLATDKDENSDELRPLTKEGVQKMIKNTRGLKQLIKKLDLIATSPRLRAKQTADIVKSSYRGTKMEVTEVLQPDAKFESFVEWLKTKDPEGSIAVVGHEPHLGALTAYLTSGQRQAFAGFKKGGIAWVWFPNEVAQRGGELRAWLQPSILRHISKGLLQTKVL